MILNLKTSGSLDKENAKRLNQIAQKIRKTFTDFIEEASILNFTKIDWWCSLPASRNTMASNLFYFCCLFELLKELIQEGNQISEIIVDSESFSKIIKDYLKKTNNSSIKIKIKKEKRLKNKLMPILRIAKAVIYFLILFISSRLTIKKSKNSSYPSILIDTVLYPGHIKQDRLYTGLWDRLSPEDRKNTFFVPNLHGFSLKELYKIFLQLRNSDNKFLLKEDYLKFKDYLYAFGHLFRIFFLNKKATYSGENFTPLIKEEIYSQKGYPSAIQALLNYRFAKNLKESKIKIKKVINRFENQVIDRGWNHGFQNFFPEIEIIGYQSPLPSAHYLCMFPTDYESRAKVIPSKIMVTGKGYFNSRGEFLKNINLITAPAFRFQWLWKERKNFPDHSFFTILVSLPISLLESDIILKMLYSTVEDKENVNYWIKPHPATSKLEIKKKFGNKWPSQFHFVEGSFNEKVEKSNLLISSFSTTCLETIARGIPTIVIGNPYGLTHNPIPGYIDNKIWKLCTSSDKLKEAIKFYKQANPALSKNFTEIGNKIREDFFAPVTEESIKDFLYS